MIPVRSEGVIYISLPMLSEWVRLLRAISFDRFGLAGCDRDVVVGFFGKGGQQVYFRIRRISQQHRDRTTSILTETTRGVPKPFIKEVVLETDTDPLVEGPDFSVCQQLSL